MTTDRTDVPASDPTGSSAYERARDEARGDPRCVPVRLEGPVPEADEAPYPDYPESDHETWSILLKRQRALLEGRACREYLDGLERIGFPEDRLPALRDASRVLQAATGWRVARVPGLLHEEDFFRFLARRVFPSTDYIRPRRELDYTPAPDLFHDVFGHLPMITHPEFADFYESMGRAARNARGGDRRRMERFYWYTVEFGLIGTPDGIRIYGSGIVSSHAEALPCLTGAVEKRPFDPYELTQQEYDVWHLQPRLYVIDSFLQLATEFEDWARGRPLL